MTILIKTKILMDNFFRRAFTILVGVLFIQNPAFARWATFEEAIVSYDNYNSTVVVNEDGSSEETVEMAITILKPENNNAGVHTIYYDEDLETIEVIAAKTVYQGKSKNVPGKMIENKAVGSHKHAFNSLKQVMVSFPTPLVGATLHLSYKRKCKAVLPKYFYQAGFFGTEGVWKKSHVILKSKLPLETLINDPNKVLKVTYKTEGKEKIVDIVLQKPIFVAVANERSIIPEELKTYYVVSSAKNYEEFGNQIGPKYEEVIKSDLPAVFSGILESARQKTSSVDQINQVTSMIQEQVRYMGDWRTREGKYFPQSLVKIAEKGVGDCKDFSVLTAAILKRLGYKVSPVLVERHYVYLPSKNGLPGLNDFNHAMVKVVDKDGKVFWIDPTNKNSMAGYIFPDIADRPALVIGVNNSTYEKIPAIKPSDCVREIEQKISFKSDAAFFEGKLNVKGIAAEEITGLFLSYSHQQVIEGVINRISGELNAKNKKVILPDLKSRIIKDLEIPYSYELDHVLISTNQGNGYKFGHEWHYDYTDITEDQVGILYLDNIQRSERKIFFQNIKADNLEALNCEIKTPWLNFSRFCKAHKGGVEISITLEILKLYITAEELKTKEYQDFKQRLLKEVPCMLVFKDKK